MTDRTVLIAGSSSGLGPAVIDVFRADGWRVVAPVRAAKARIEPPAGPGVEYVPGVDLTDPDGVAEAVTRATGDPARPLTAVVNLVGGYAQGGKVHETPLADFEAQFAINLRPAYLLAQATLPALVAAGGGALVLVSSRAALQPFAGAAGYVASKAALNALTQAIAVEYRTDRVRCNAVLPSVIDTPKNRAAQPDADHSRWVPPAEIATVIRFLAGTESAPTSGAMIPVYGRA
jgi:NAD(P)-dependent dehydrogenase (short-subunit alcohol dehydrogenase family)